jgi:hypothetical protein
MKAFYIIITIIILLFIAIALSTSVSYSPYMMNNMHKNYYPYEGFSSNISYANANGNTKAAAAEPPASVINNIKKAPCKKIFGFDGLFCDPHGAEEKLDYFSELKGGSICEGSGLSNSKGSLCLDETSLGLLTTRGGNAKGGDSQIGA